MNELEQMEWFRAEELTPAPVMVPESPNPMVRTAGAGPDGTMCRTCLHLIAKRYSKTYYKCKLRQNTNGQATDHRVRWPTCSKYQINTS